MNDVSYKDSHLPLQARLYFNLWVRLHQTSHAIENANQKAFSGSGLSIMRSAVLFLAQALGKKATIAEISRWVFREAHTVTSLVNRMEKEGLVIKVKDLNKKNLVRVIVTDKGLQVYQSVTTAENLYNLFAVLSEEEQQQLFSYLDRILHAAIKQIGKNGVPGLPRDFISENQLK